MIQQNTIGQRVELQVVNSGGCLTEAYPTNFHNFYTRKMLVGSEKAEDFKEVTAAQKATIEAADAAWERPPQSVIDQWNAIGALSVNANFGVRFNENTGYFEANGLKDITYRQALAILRAVGLEKFERLGIRTNLLLTSFYPDGRYYASTFRSSSVEVAVFWSTIFSCPQVFEYCQAVHTVLPELDFTNVTSDPGNGAFNTINLTNIKIKNLKVNLNFAVCWKLSYESIEYLVNNAANTKAITITVHANVFAKLTGDMTKDAYNNLTDEEKEQWTSLLEQAVDKNIQFVKA